MRSPPPLMKKLGRTHWDEGAGLWVRPPPKDRDRSFTNEQGLEVPDAMARVGRTYWDRGREQWALPPGGLSVGGRSRYDPEVQKMLASGVNLDTVSV
jgi:hypothetical protein